MRRKKPKKMSKAEWDNLYSPQKMRWMKKRIKSFFAPKKRKRRVKKKVFKR